MAAGAGVEPVGDVESAVGADGDVAGAEEGFGVVGAGGFVTAGGIPVGIYRESTQALLASTTVTSGDPLNGDFRYHSITPLTLLAGVQYRVVGS